MSVARHGATPAEAKHVRVHFVLVESRQAAITKRLGKVFPVLLVAGLDPRPRGGVTALHLRPDLAWCDRLDAAGQGAVFEQQLLERRAQCAFGTIVLCHAVVCIGRQIHVPISISQALIRG